MDSKKLRKQYMHLMPRLNKAMQHVQSQLSDLPPHDFLLETNLKPYLSIKKKMLRENESDPAALSDLVRGRIFFSEDYQFEDVLNIINKLFKDKIKNVDKKTDRAKEHGLEYHGILHVDMDFDGINFELQIMPLEYKPYKEFLHQIYEKFRTPKELEKMSDKQKKFLSSLHNRLYKALDKKSKANRKKSD